MISDFLPSIEGGPLRTLLSHYLEVRGTKRLPSRGDIDPLKLAPVLPIIWISEYEPEAGTFRYRLAGEEVNAIFGASVSGRLLSDFVIGERFEPVNRNFLRVIGDPAAMLTTGPVYRCADRIAMGERLALPLSSDGEKADGIIGATLRKSLVDLAEVATLEQKSVFTPIDDLDDRAQAQSANARGD